ncbi:A24 family peptidase [Paenibacillus sinopodophylli]|uniref:A24 family peptidase n=1 Tax=Paenibacillus sinopodophylli TaxID=1837342 RepID=UPI001486ED9D|nr:A24 family peptidase [Paenibacillus sinopodophylli]
MDLLPMLAIATLLIWAFITDLKSQIIPNRLTLPFFVAAFIYHTVANGLTGAGAAALGAAAGFVPLLLLHMAKGIGAGDVKLFGAIGAWTGVLVVLQLMFYAILYAGAIGLLLLLVNRDFGKRVASGVIAIISPAAGWRKPEWLQWAGSGKKFPFMLAVAPAAVTVWSIFNI